MTDGLFSIQDCENWLALGSETEDGRNTDRIVKQLADTIRENDRLREACKAVDDLWTVDETHITHMSYKDETELWKSPVGIAWKKVREALSNKDSDIPSKTSD